MFSEAQSKATDVRPKVTDAKPFQLMHENIFLVHKRVRFYNSTKF